jgi:phosphohistidine phosphatase
MRHGPAEDVAPSGRDVDRRLTPAGRDRTRLVALELAREGEEPKRILTSPLARAVETAAVVTEALGTGLQAEVTDALAPGGAALDLVFELSRAGAKRVMLIGHEPDLSALVSTLLPQWRRGFDKSMVVGVRIRDGERPKERFVLEPKTLEWAR